MYIWVMNLMHYLIKEKGYSPFRKSTNGERTKTHDLAFSSISGEWVDIRLVKGDHEVTFGLLEEGYPPTLIHPLRDSISVKDGGVTRQLLRHEWDAYLGSRTNEEIYSEILKFDLNETNTR